MKREWRFKKVKVALILIGVLFVASLAIRIYNSHRFHLERQTRVMMDTYVSIYAVGPKRVTSRAIDVALNRMQEVDRKFSIHNSKSPVYAFNHQGVPITDQEILMVVRRALEVARDSEGAFDITIGPLSELWGFYGESPHIPSAQAIKETMGRVGYRYLLVEEGRLQKAKESIRIDLGGIAKGYGVREAARVLREEGVSSALIDAGGDVYALGKRGRKLWKVGIRSPREEDLLGYLEVEDLAVMGSGDYERFFIKDGKRYHHIFDPKTGYPAEGLSGLTLVHPDPLEADAWNTALFVLGAKRGLEMVERTPGMEAIMVTKSGEVLYSSGMKNRLNPISGIE